jgi:hypothetical protein
VPINQLEELPTRDRTRILIEVGEEEARIRPESKRGVLGEERSSRALVEAPTTIPAMGVVFTDKTGSKIEVEGGPTALLAIEMDNVSFMAMAIVFPKEEERMW